jgi:hypothetical protein
MQISIEQLKSQNPWWDHPDFIEKDYHIKTYNEQSLKWYPKILSEFNLNHNNIYTLRGPRQIGKTTSIKLLIKKLLKQNAKNTNIFYYSCNNIDNYNEFLDLLNVYLDWISDSGDKSRVYIFIDEVTFIKEWERAIKHLADLGKLKNKSLILTGSNTYDLKYGTERLPGRRGHDNNLDKILYPMNFYDFVELKNPNLLNKFKNKNWKQIKNVYEFNQKLLQKLFNQYLLSGGIISNINDIEKNSEIGLNKYLEYLNWTLGDLIKLGKKEILTRHILLEIIKTTTSSLGWDTIAKKVATSHVTVSEYVEILELIFVLKTVYQVNLNSGLLELKKNKKIYFTDPFIFWSFYGWIMSFGNYFEESKKMILDHDFKAKFIESIVFDHLLKYEKSYEFGNKIFFMKETKEIDFLFRKDKKKFLAIEVKYQNQINNKDFDAIKKHGCKKGVIISKDTINIASDFKILPIELFLLIEKALLN